MRILRLISMQSKPEHLCSTHDPQLRPRDHSCKKKKRKEKKRGKRNVMRNSSHDGSADHRPSRDECGSSAWLLVMSSHTYSCNQGYSKHQEPKTHVVTGRNVMIYLIHMQECYKTVLFLVRVCERGRSFITKLSGGSWRVLESHGTGKHKSGRHFWRGKKICVLCVRV